MRGGPVLVPLGQDSLDAILTSSRLAIRKADRREDLADLTLRRWFELQLLLVAALAYHANFCHVEMAVLGRIFVHAMLFHFSFGFLFGPMHVGISH